MINFVQKVKNSVLNRFSFLISRQRLSNSLMNWELKGLDRKVKKALLLQELNFLASKEGVIVECGVGSGWSLSILALVSNKQIFAFDSFDGFPKGSQHDAISFDPLEKNIYKEFTVDFVINNMVGVGVSKDDIKNRITFRKGFFPDSFLGFNYPISFMHIDCDLYKSCLDSLQYLYQYVSIGGIVTFDEYDSEADLVKWPGAKKAIDEFFKEKDVSIKKHWTGFSYVQKT